VTWLPAALLYLVVHLALYALALRHVRAFTRERPIFLYHAVPAALLAVTVVVEMVIDPQPLTVAAGVLVLSLQGIYSLSFLELWSLAQGGYSLGILDHLASVHDGFDTGALRDLGATKKATRIQAMGDLGLVRSQNSVFLLSRGGASLATAFATIVWITNSRVD
jgi:hypothetical protein